jgi:hypothetical protein
MGVLFGVFLDDGNTVARFPVNPIDQLPIGHPTENERVNVLGIGEIALGRKPKLRTVAWESFFPVQSGDSYAVDASEYKTPEWWVEFIKAIQAKADEEPARLIIDRRSESGDVFYSDDFQVLIEAFDPLDKGGEPGDIYYSIEFVEWKPHEAKVVTLQTPADTGASGQSGDSQSGASGQPSVSSQQTEPVQAVTTEQRGKSVGELAVGDEVIVNGNYWYTSYGDEPHGSASNKRVTITRIVKSPKLGQSMPILVGSLGWVMSDQLSPTGDSGEVRL